MQINPRLSLKSNQINIDTISINIRAVEVYHKNIISLNLLHLLTALTITGYSGYAG